MKALLWIIVTLPAWTWAQIPPEPEYPYPKTTKPAVTVEAPQKVGPNGTYYYSTDQKKSDNTGIEGVEKPERIDDDGTYYYGDDFKPNPNTKYGVEKPTRRDSDGFYYYDPKAEPKKQKHNYTAPPDKVLSNGTYMYDSEPTPASNVLSLRLGLYGPPNIRSDKAGASDFKTIYSDSASFIFTFDYDWNLYRGIDLKIGSGLMNTKGQGQFVGTSNAGLTPKESFQFFVFPNTITLSYKFKIWDIQLLTPYVDAGPGYFTFLETRSDGDKTSFGGAMVFSATAGVLISLGAYASGSEMQNDYGVNETWIDLQFRQIFGLDSRKDFSSSMITGGFAIGF